MKKFTAKNLTETIKYVFKSNNNQQIMLTRIMENEMFFPFLQGADSVQVLCPNKETFFAKIKALEEPPGCFQLTPVQPTDAPDKLHRDETLVLLFQLSRGAYVSQAKISDIHPKKLKVLAIDPRLNTRFKTRIPISLLPINEAVFTQLKSQKMTIKRIVEYSNPSHMLDPRQCRDFLVSSEMESIDPIPHLACTEESVSGLLSDLSLGGCCIYVPIPAPIQAIQKYMFVFTEIPIPCIEKRISVSVFSVVRHIRQSKKWAIFHCMFLESLPPELTLF